MVCWYRRRRSGPSSSTSCSGRRRACSSTSRRRERAPATSCWRTGAAARKARRSIPGDLALVVFDDLYFAPLLEPSLTAIAYDARAIGHEGARLLLGVVGNEGNTGREVRIDVSLVRRRSCGCDYDPGTELAEAVA